jgi:hypothetical protein
MRREEERRGGGERRGWSGVERRGEDRRLNIILQNESE